jgi:hypothetical protein
MVDKNWHTVFQWYLTWCYPPLCSPNPQVSIETLKRGGKTPLSSSSQNDPSNENKESCSNYLHPWCQNQTLLPLRHTTPSRLHSSTTMSLSITLPAPTICPVLKRSASYHGDILLLVGRIYLSTITYGSCAQTCTQHPYISTIAQ